MPLWARYWKRLISSCKFCDSAELHISSLQGLSEVKAGSADPQTVETLKLAIASFNHFDKDGNGSLMQV